MNNKENFDAMAEVLKSFEPIRNLKVAEPTECIMLRKSQVSALIQVINDWENEYSSYGQTPEVKEIVRELKETIEEQKI